tara:strand:+ start:8407 stop:8865 length:459 start_codon:yes stop_codon:yes gene_type:complete
MAKHRLKLHDFDQEYVLLAIHSNAEIFKVAYSLNDLLKISLKRENDICIENFDYKFSLYKYISSKYKSKMFLFSNRSQNSNKLNAEATLFNELDTSSLFILEFPKVEFFLKIEEGKFNIKDLIFGINNCKNITSCYQVNLKRDKSKYNLIFE